MFLVLRTAARAEDCVMRLGVECFKQQTRAQIRAEKRLLQRNDPQSAYPR